MESAAFRPAPMARITVAEPVTMSPPAQTPFLVVLPVSGSALITVILLGCSNVFMTFAWYGNLRNLSHRAWIIAALVSWGIALFEYLLQVPANRIGNQVMNVGQLKILQEVITLSVFVPFSLLYLKEKLTMDYLYAGCCLLGAVFFIFRAKFFGA